MCDCTARIMSDPSSYEKLAELKSENSGVFHKLGEAVRNILERLKKALKIYENEVPRFDAYDLGREAYEKLQDLYLKAFNEAEKNYTAAESNGSGEKFQIRNDFYKEYDAWDKKKTGFSFVIGRTSEILKKLGVKDKVIKWDTSKIIKIKAKHPTMTDNVIKQVPNILENPIVIMKSKTNTSRLTLFGEVYDTDNTPVLAVLELNPRDNKGTTLDLIKIASAYGKNTNLQNFITSSEILYVDENKKRVNNWLKVNGLSLPKPNRVINSNNNISQKNTAVNNIVRENTKNIQKNTKNEQKKFSRRNIDDFDVSEYNQIRLPKREYAMVMSAIRSQDGENFESGSVRKVYAYDSSYLYTYIDRKPVILTRKENTLNISKGEYTNEINQRAVQSDSRDENSRNRLRNGEYGSDLSRNSGTAKGNDGVFDGKNGQRNSDNRVGYSENGNNADLREKRKLSERFPDYYTSLKDLADIFRRTYTFSYRKSDIYERFNELTKVIDEEQFAQDSTEYARLEETKQKLLQSLAENAAENLKPETDEYISSIKEYIRKSRIKVAQEEKSFSAA